MLLVSAGKLRTRYLNTGRLEERYSLTLVKTLAKTTGDNIIPEDLFLKIFWKRVARNGSEEQI